MSEIKNVEIDWGSRFPHYQREVTPEGYSVTKAKREQLLGATLIHDNDTDYSAKIKEMAKRLDVYHEKLSDAELLNRVLDGLGDEGVDDDESTFDEKVDRLEYILGGLGEYPY